MRRAGLVEKKKRAVRSAVERVLCCAQSLGSVLASCTFLRDGRPRRRSQGVRAPAVRRPAPRSAVRRPDLPSARGAPHLIPQRREQFAQVLDEPHPPRPPEETQVALALHGPHGALRLRRGPACGLEHQVRRRRRAVELPQTAREHLPRVRRRRRAAAPRADARLLGPRRGALRRPRGRLRGAVPRRAPRPPRGRGLRRRRVGPGAHLALRRRRPRRGPASRRKRSKRDEPS